MKKKVLLFTALIIAACTAYAGVVYYGAGRAVFLENIIQFANFFELEATGIKNLRVGGELAAHNIQAANVDKNFIPFGAFETSDEDFTSYVDAAGVAPVDGTGGGASSFLTCAQSSTTPLEGNGSLNMVKFNTASGGQGHGCSYDFTVSTAGQAQGMTLSFDYKWTDVAANEDGDFRVYIYDVDKSVLIEPVPFEINRSSFVTKYISGFMTDATSTNYRIIFHLAQDRAGVFSLKVDNLFIGKSTYARGSPITDWVGYTPVWDGSTTQPSIGNGILSGKWRRVGDSMEVSIYLEIGSTTNVGSGTWRLTLPTGYSADQDKLASDPSTSKTTYGNSAVGIFSVIDSTASFDGNQGHAFYQFSTYAGGSTEGAFFNFDKTANNVSNTYPITWADDDSLHVVFSVPILGWSSNVVMSETMPGRDIVLVLEGNASPQSIASGGTHTKVTNWAVIKDQANIWDATNSQLTIPESGYYSLTGQLRYNSDADLDLVAQYISFYKNNTQFKVNTPWGSTGAGGSFTIPHLSVITYLLKGDIIDVRTQQANTDADALNLAMSSTSNFFSLAKLNSGSQTIGLEETVLQKVSQQLPATLGAAGSLLRSNGTTGEWNSSVYVAADGKVGIGTSSPSTTFGGLDIASGGIGLVVGADENATTRTNATTKNSRITQPHYTNSEEPVGLIRGQSTATVNAVSIGGGSGVLNAATQIGFFTGATNTTLDGTERMRIDSSGNVSISSAGAKRLTVTGTSASDTSQITIGSVGASGTSTLALIGDSTYSSFGLKFQRSTGANGNSFFDHRGTGTLYIRTTDGGEMHLETNSVLRVQLTNTGIYRLNSLTTNGTLTTTGSNGTLAVSSSSDMKIADGEIENALAKVNALTPRYFYWKPEHELGSDRQLGFFAQEVNQILGEEVANTPADGISWGIYDRGLVAMAYKAIQELNAKHEAESQAKDIQISSLQSDVAALIARIEALEAR
jgi:hypothetical protein